jgi:hypothetical protein
MDSNVVDYCDVLVLVAFQLNVLLLSSNHPKQYLHLVSINPNLHWKTNLINPDAKQKNIELLKRRYLIHLHYHQI